MIDIFLIFLGMICIPVALLLFISVLFMTLPYNKALQWSMLFLYIAERNHGKKFLERLTDDFDSDKVREYIERVQSI